MTVPPPGDVWGARPGQPETPSTMKKTTWTTYATRGYTYDVAQDQRSAGGVHYHQVRKTKTGWQKRIVQANGMHSASGPTSAISDADGEAAFSSAKNC